jgi:pimeloyl-ACP methyl ester carboxylesterase
MFLSTPLPVGLATVDVLRTFDPTSLAPSVKVPAIYVHGSDDEIVPIEVAETCATSSSNARVEIISESGHLVPVDQPERLTTLFERLGD